MNKSDCEHIQDCIWMIKRELDSLSEFVRANTPEPADNGTSDKGEE